MIWLFPLLVRYIIAVTSENSTVTTTEYTTNKPIQDNDTTDPSIEHNHTKLLNVSQAKFKSDTESGRGEKENDVALSIELKTGGLLKHEILLTNSSKIKIHLVKHRADAKNETQDVVLLEEMKATESHTQDATMNTELPAEREHATKGNETKDGVKLEIKLINATSIEIQAVKYKADTIGEIKGLVPKEDTVFNESQTQQTTAHIDKLIEYLTKKHTTVDSNIYDIEEPAFEPILKKIESAKNKTKDILIIIMKEPKTSEMQKKENKMHTETAASATKRTTVRTTTRSGTQIAVPKNCPKCRKKRTLAKCIDGNIILNKCVKCICKNRYYECSSTACDKGAQKALAKNGRCIPNMRYIHMSMTCICTKHGIWPNNNCSFIFGSLYKLRKTVSRTTSTCKPHTFIIIDCNVCQCGSNGEIDDNHCTKNDCPSKSYSGRRTTIHLLGSCDPGNWYSLAPCQFCYCMNSSKLVCSSRFENPKVHELGSYNLTICGKDMIRYIMNIIPSKNREARLETGIVNLQSAFSSETTTYVDDNMQKTTTLTTERNVHADYNSIEYPKTVKDAGSTIYSTPKTLDIPIHSQEFKQREEENNEFISKIKKENDKVSDEPKSEINYDNSKYSAESEEEMRDTAAMRTVTHQTDDNQTITNNQLPSEASFKVEDNPPQINSSMKKDQTPIMTIPKAGLASTINKILAMVLRKSTVNITADFCKPGESSQRDCNICYCLANGKLLCTVQKCNK